MRRRGAAASALNELASNPKKQKTNTKEEEDDSDHTLNKRRRLKQSVERGVLQVSHSSLKTSLSCLDLINHKDALKVLSRSPKLGAGVYGDAKELVAENGKNAFVAKVTSCYSPLLGSLSSPFRSENVEPRMLHLLWKHVGESGRSPHLIAPLTEHVIVDGCFKNRKYKYDNTFNSTIFVMEKATGKDVRSFLGYLHQQGPEFDLAFLTILFQVCYTLQSIYNLYPNFRHNDLQDSNVFLHAIPKTGHIRYTMLNGETFYVPNTSGVFVLIADGDFSCIGGLVDNYKVIEHEFNTPTFNIGTRQDQSSDIYLFLKYCLNTCREKCSDNLIQKLKNAWGTRGSLPDGTHILDAFVPKNRNDKKGNSYRLSGTFVKYAPTVGEILSSSLFDCFKTPLPNKDLYKQQHYKATKAGPNESVMIFPAWNPHHHLKQKDNVLMRRHAPVLEPRPGFRYMFEKPFDNVVPPSMQNFSSWTTEPVHLDKWSAQYISTYKPTFTQHILKTIKVAYDSPPNEKDDTPGHAYDPEKWDEFQERIVRKASTFIDAIKVPKFWWMAVFTCAFVDVAWEMGLSPMEQSCWHIDTWTDFWMDTFEAIVYSPDQLLHFCLQWNWYRDLMPLKQDL